jgi:hypothetical protein
MRISHVLVSQHLRIGKPVVEMICNAVGRGITVTGRIDERVGHASVPMYITNIIAVEKWVSPRFVNVFWEICQIISLRTKGRALHIAV